MKTLTCKEARQLDMVDYLASLGHYPTKVTNRDYWYKSPLREENTASFKVNRDKNLWFDFGTGKGGDIINFGTLYFNCPVNELLKKLSQQSTQHFSFHPLSPAASTLTSHSSPSGSPAGEKKEPGNNTILVLESRELSAQSLLIYLQERCIPLEIAERFCKEVDFELYNRKHTAIGFLNDKGGYELRNAAHKLSSSPKSTRFLDNGSNEVAVLEGFFDFLSHQLIYKEAANQSNFLVLNSLAFFYLSKPLMDKHATVNLYLDRNTQGIKCTTDALKWDNKKYFDRSKFLKQGQDLNEWLVEQSRLKADLLQKHDRPGYSKGRGI